MEAAGSQEQANANLSVFKEFPLSKLREGARLEFRLETYNAFNHPQFWRTEYHSQFRQFWRDHYSGKLTATGTGSLESVLVRAL